MLEEEERKAGTSDMEGAWQGWKDYVLGVTVRESV